MKKRSWLLLATCGSVLAGGITLAGMKQNPAEANSSTLPERATEANQAYEAQKKIANAPGATTEEEQKLKELATKAADLDSALNPKSDLEEFQEVFTGYKDLHLIHSSHYEDKKDSTDPAVQKVLHSLKEKGELIARFEKLQQAKSLTGESLLSRFLDETDQLNRELYPERFK
ncbi:hypothetical protein HGI30_20355 [Paenibacillus albicereus]|uniref:Lipoprotein n=1 Tax=Paenibacillus albicereus TaxID=2726185 RepID=A0A6H2H2T6_9BACL|nr:hypothetical protein [Paenibacillus albicereus]QJC53648.1 hypothetical protein HGI30_20355 [Paenibacillus albicereus]